MAVILFIIIIFLIITIASVSSNKNKEITTLKKSNQDLDVVLAEVNKTNENLNSEIRELQNKVTELSKYEGLLDVEQKAKEIILEANDYKKKISDSEAQIILEANETLKNAKMQANDMVRKAQEKFDSSITESSKIIQQAELKASEIAGSAYDAMKNAENYEKTVIAMKNIIKGYGDEYLKPTFSLLDDLAEEFGHTEAGQSLKVARERNIGLVRNDLAAKSDYVEQNRNKLRLILFWMYSMGKWILYYQK